MGPQRALEYVNVTIRSILPVEVHNGFLRDLPFWYRFEGHWVTVLGAAATSTVGAALAYLALLRGRLTSKLDSLVLKYFPSKPLLAPRRGANIEDPGLGGSP